MNCDNILILIFKDSIDHKNWLDENSDNFNIIAMKYFHE